MKTLRRFITLAGFISRLAAYVVVSGDAYLFIPNAHRRRQYLTEIATRYARRFLELFGVSVRFQETGGASGSPRRPRFIVANHLSTLDIFILASQGPVVFITSTEIENTPILGLVAQLGGVVFVNRRNFFNLPAEIDQVTHLFRQGHDIVLFAEATSHNGDEVHPFKNAFFTVPIRVGADIQPACINFLSIDGKPITPENRDQIYYYGDIPFWKHLWRLCGNRSVEAECLFLRPISTADGLSRKQVSPDTHQVVAARFKGLANFPTPQPLHSRLSSTTEPPVIALSR